MQNHTKAFANIVFLLCSTICAAESPSALPKIVDGFQGLENRDMGREFRNHMPAPDRERGRLKIKKLRELNRDVAVQEFLGRKIEFIRVTYFQEKEIKDFKEAENAVRRLLASVILPAKKAQQEPFLYAPWAEGTRPPILRALIFYEGGFIGRIETDGKKLFLQDNDGLFWWDRLYESASR